MSMREITCGQAVREALAEEMRRDPAVFCMGEDVAIYGGSFKITKGLFEEFGEERVRDTPISEAGVVGAGVGAALTGMRPVVEVMFCDFTTIAMDQLVNQAAKVRYMFGGKARVPLTIRTTIGGGRSGAAQHSQSLHALFAHVPGLKVVVPSTPYLIKGLLKASIRDDNPVIFCENKTMYNIKGLVPDEDYVVPLGRAWMHREGRDVTIIATSSMVYKALDAAKTLAEQGIEAEVMDPCGLYPLDIESLAASVRKTHRCVIVDEGVRRYGATAEISAGVYEHAFDYIDAPIVRIGASENPMPFSPPLEQATIPQAAQIVAAVQEMLGVEQRVMA
jgi:pyruvate/2-oxoglutarate/acetoin dehydrogenase E1 component